MAKNVCKYLTLLKQLIAIKLNRICLQNSAQSLY